jgi:hypothetical protein
MAAPLQPPGPVTNPVTTTVSPAGLTVKGNGMSPAQLAVAETLLQVGQRLGAPAICQVAIIYAGIWESGLTPSPGNGRQWGVLSGSVNTFGQYDTVGMAASFMDGGKGFQAGGAISLAQTVSNPVQIAIEVEAPSIWPNNAYAAQPGYPGDQAAIAEATRTVKRILGAGISITTPGGIAGLGGTGTQANTTPVSAWIVGDASNPDQDYWTTCNQYAQDAQCYFFSDGERLYLADGIKLMAQTPALVIGLRDPRVTAFSATYDNTSFDYAVSHRRGSRIQRRATLTRASSPTQIQMSVICAIDEVRGGDVVYLVDAGIASGLWLVGDAVRPIELPYTQLTLVKGMMPLSAITGETIGPQTLTGKAASRPGAGTPISMMIEEANRITAADYPYVWGGGHAKAGSPSTGQSGNIVGFDCSGSVAAVLAAGGFIPRGAQVPTDAGVIAELEANGVLVPGAGAGIPECTLWDLPGTHIFMRLNGRYFGTSDGENGNSSQPNGGAGWLYDQHLDAAGAPQNGYHVYHIKPGFLAQQVG